jgi:flagellar protein FliO/FliZ
MLRRFLKAVLFQSILASAAIAQTSGKFAAPSATAATQDLDSGGGVLQIFGSLALVLATILVIGWIARRVRAIPRSRGGRLKLIDEVTIGPKERAVILEVDGMHLVLGVGEGRVTILHRAPAISSRTEIEPATEVGADRSGSFLDVLKRSLSK